MSNVLVGIINDNGKLIGPEIIGTFNNHIANVGAEELGILTLKLIVKFNRQVWNFQAIAKCFSAFFAMQK